MSRNGAREKKKLRKGALHLAFGHLFRRCHLRSQQAFAKAFDGSDLSPLQYGILELVQLNPGITHGELAEGMVTAPSVVTTAMKPLLDSQFLIKRADDNDGRRGGHFLTPNGRNFFAALREALPKAEELLLAPLSQEEQRALQQLLQKLTASSSL